METAAGSRAVTRRGASRPLDLLRIEVKVVLHSHAGAAESVWCTVVDPARNLYRVASIPSLCERPTFGNLIVAPPGRDGIPGYRRTHALGGYRHDAIEYADSASLGPLVNWPGHTRGVKAEGFGTPTAEAPCTVGLGSSSRPQRRRVEEVRGSAAPEPAPQRRANTGARPGRPMQGPGGREGRCVAVSEGRGHHETRRSEHDGRGAMIAPARREAFRRICERRAVR
jgi:hypothetical protein